MKAAEKNVKRKAHYDHLEQNADAARRFHEPAAVKSKMTKLASVKIIEHYIEHTDDEDGENPGNNSKEMHEGRRCRWR